MGHRAIPSPFFMQALRVNPSRHSALLRCARARARSFPHGVVSSPRYSGTDCSVVASGNDDSSVVVGAYPGSWGECDTKCGGGTRRVVRLAMQACSCRVCVCLFLCVYAFMRAVCFVVYFCLVCCRFVCLCVCLVACACSHWSSCSY